MRRITSPLQAAALAFCLAACKDNSDEPTFLPESGDWLLTDVEVVNNTCTSIPPAELPTIVPLDYVSGNSFQVVIEDDLEPVTCVLAETEFECSDLVRREGGDTEFLTYTTVWRGGFNSETELVAVSTTDITCTGTLCDSGFKSLPCSKVSTFAAEAL